MFVGRVFVSVLAGCLAANSTSGFSVMEAAATSTQLCQPSAVAFLLQGLWRPPPNPAMHAAVESDKDLHGVTHTFTGLMVASPGGLHPPLLPLPAVFSGQTPYPC